MGRKRMVRGLLQSVQHASVEWRSHKSRPGNCSRCEQALEDKTYRMPGASWVWNT